MSMKSICTQNIGIAASLLGGGFEQAMGMVVNLLYKGHLVYIIGNVDLCTGQFTENISN